MEEGILNINKPQDMTSFDVIAILRKKLGIKRIGHFGTLDPMALGVLPVAVGKATRVMDYLDVDMKEYIAEVKFGILTDTDDITGNTIEEVDASCITEEVLKEKLECFKGVISQTPPRYSAIKVHGKKLYEYARKGQEIEIKSRRVFINEIELVEFSFNEKNHPLAKIRISCSKGTYIRAIARDLGGTLISLLRTKSGMFSIENAVSIGKISEMKKSEILNLMEPVDSVLAIFPKVTLGKWEGELFSHGVYLNPHQWSPEDEGGRNSFLADFPLGAPETYKRLFRVYDFDGSFIGTGLSGPDCGLKADKIFIERH